MRLSENGNNVVVILETPPATPTRDAHNLVQTMAQYDRDEFFSPVKRPAALLQSINAQSTSGTPLLLAAQFKPRDGFVKPPKPTLWQSIKVMVFEAADELKGFVILVLSIAAITAICALTWPDARSWLLTNRNELLEYASIPIVAVGFTYCHIAIALQLMFYPIEFIGCCQNKNGIGFGWQGIVPRKAIKMATKAVDLMTEKLIKMNEVFGRLDPLRVAAELQPTLRPLLEETFADIGPKMSPYLWPKLPVAVKTGMIQKAVDDAPTTVADLMKEVQDNIDHVFDIKHMVTTALVQDKELLNEIFITCGAKEFRFIKISGAWIGFAFGLLQMGIYFFRRDWWILPLMGGVGGWFTNWIALKLIFEPVEPIDLGCYTLQGLFLKRQQEVSVAYASLISTRVLTAHNMLLSMLSGPLSAKLAQIVSSHVGRAIDQYAGAGLPVIFATIGAEQHEKLKREVAGRLLAKTPAIMQRLEAYTDEALDVENLLVEKMSGLSSVDFEGMLHPVFQEDEIILIAMGGFLGVVIGAVQQITMGA